MPAICKSLLCFHSLRIVGHLPVANVEGLLNLPLLDYLLLTVRILLGVLLLCLNQEALVVAVAPLNVAARVKFVVVHRPTELLTREVLAIPNVLVYGRDRRVSCANFTFVIV